MNKKKEKLLQDLKEMVLSLAYDDTATLDIILRKAQMVMRNLYGKNTHYLKDLEAISFYSSVYPVSKEFEIKLWERGKQKMANLFETMLEELSLFGGTTKVDLDEKSYDKYIDEQRIQELVKIRSKDFDLSKLIQILHEINICHREKCFCGMIALTRALIDHVPPIFNCKTFSEVANNYKGSKSFKESIMHLEKSCRKIADQYLHCQIRKSEVLPNLIQVNFSNDLDILLSEIIRILK